MLQSAVHSHLYHFSTSTLPTSSYLFSSYSASNHSLLLMIFLGMPTPHEYLILSFIPCGSALKSWLRNAIAVAATVQLCSTTLGMWWGCLWTCALGGLDITLILVWTGWVWVGDFFFLRRRFWAVRCRQWAVRCRQCGLFWKALYWHTCLKLVCFTVHFKTTSVCLRCLCGTCMETLKEVLWRKESQPKVVFKKVLLWLSVSLS